MGLSHDRCIDGAVAEIHAIAAACEGADPATPVPTCEDWTLADLLRHIGMVNRWAATMVELRSQERLERDESTIDVPDDDTALAAWVGAGAGFVRDRFLASDPSTAMWAWGVPKSVAFWPRRMLHETGVHRADAELALGRVPTFEPTLAADGIDELLDNLPEAARFRPGVRELTGDGEVLAFASTDGSGAWRVELVADGFRWARSDAPVADADATITGSSGDLLLALYGRQPADVDGSEELWEHWRTHSAL